MLYVDKSRSNIHLSGDYNLDSANGIKDALAKLDRVRRALVHQGRRIDNKESVKELSVKETTSSWDRFLDSSIKDD